MLYKVLKRDQSGLSSIAEHHPHTFAEGEITSSPRAPIFVYTSPTMAMTRHNTLPQPTEVWEVEADYVWKVERIIHTMEPRLQIAEDVQRWWNREIELKTMGVPWRTAVVPALKLVRKIS